MGPSPELATTLDYYPAYLALHAFGIAALVGGRQGNLAYVLANWRAKLTDGSDVSLLRRVVERLRDGTLDTAIRNADSSYNASNIFSSRYVMSYLMELLREWVPEENRYEALYCEIEYKLGLVRYDLLLREIEHNRGPVDRDRLEHERKHVKALNGLYLTHPDLATQVKAEIDQYKEKWPYLRAGLFSGSLNRLQEIKLGFDREVDSARNSSR